MTELEKMIAVGAERPGKVTVLRKGVCCDVGRGLEAAGADAAFVQTFVQPLSPWNPDPRLPGPALGA